MCDGDCSKKAVTGRTSSGKSEHPDVGFSSMSRPGLSHDQPR